MDASKYPKAAKLQQQREDRFNAELVRRKAEELIAKQNQAISVKVRTKTQQDECMAAERAIAGMRKKK